MKKLILIMFCMVLLVGTISAWSTNTFNNSLTSEYLTFTGNQNITKWLQVPEDNWVINGFMNISGEARPFTNPDCTNTTCIYTIEDLDSIRNNLSGSYSLTRDLDFNDCNSYENCSNQSQYTTGSGWTPIGSSGNEFTGTINGNGHKVSNLFIDRNVHYQAFISYAENTTIENFYLEDTNVSGWMYSSSLVARVDISTTNSIINNTGATGTIDGSAGCGGLIGVAMNLIISNSYFEGYTRCDNGPNGGLIGAAFSGVDGEYPIHISNSYSTGSINSPTFFSSDDLGGLVGNIGGSGSSFTSANTITNSYSKTNLNYSGGTHKGGLVGYAQQSNITNSYSIGNVTGATNEGGLVGTFTSTGSNNIANSFYDTNTSGQNDTGKGEPKTTIEMKDISTFSGVGWDIVNESSWNNEVWSINDGNSYPKFGWELLFYPSNPYLEIGTPDGTYEWNYTGEYNTTEQTSNLRDSINTYLSSCTYSGGYCNVPFLFHSNTTGILQYSNMNFNSSGIIVESEQYNDPVIEGATESFNITILTNQQLSSSDLIYNGTSYSGSFTLNSQDVGYNYTATISQIIPSVTADENVTFYWSFTLADSSVENSTTHSQTILNLGVDDCSTYNNTLLNYTLFDEETLNSLSGTIEVWLKIYSLNYQTPFIEFNTTKTSTNSLCVSINLANSSFYMDAKAKYYSSPNETTGHRIEYYNIQKYLFNNSILPINVSLYDLPNSVATRFVIIYKGEDFLPVSNSLIDITREYVGDGVFRTIEIPITDTYGKAVASLRKDDTTYTIYVKKNGVLLATFENIVPVCENELTEECEINLNSFGSTESPTNFYTLNNIAYSLDYDDSTRDITASFTILDGSTATITLNATLYNRFENTSICSQSLTSSSGTLTCNVPSTYDNSTVQITLYKSASPTIIITQTYLSLYPDTASYFGTTRIILIIVLVLTIPFMFITSLTGMVIGGMIGIILATLLLLSTGGTNLGITVSVVWLIISGAIIIWRLTRGGYSD